MNRSPHRPALRPIARVSMGLEVLLSLGALAGGTALMVGPRGEIIPLQVAALQGSPFDTYFVPGLILFAVLGLGPIAAAMLAFARQPLAPLAALVVGVGLLIWLIVEIAIVGYSSNPPLQPIYLMLGVAIVAAALRWLGSQPAGERQHQMKVVRP